MIGNQVGSSSDVQCVRHAGSGRLRGSREQVLINSPRNSHMISWCIHFPLSSVARNFKHEGPSLSRLFRVHLENLDGSSQERLWQSSYIYGFSVHCHMTSSGSDNPSEPIPRGNITFQRAECLSFVTSASRPSAEISTKIFVYAFLSLKRSARNFLPDPQPPIWYIAF